MRRQVPGDWNRIQDINTLVDVGSDPAILDQLEAMHTGVGKNICQRKVETIYFGHGEPVCQEAQGLLAASLANLKR
jgi:hypothetical protein